MELSSKSWHARLYKWRYRVEPPPNLCPYFWKLVWAILYPLIMLCMVVWYFLEFNWWAFLILPGIIVFTIVVVYLAHRFPDKEKPKKNKSTLLGEFIKAKYNKYCPQIKWIK